MSMNEMESKIRELRQLQILIEEAQAELRPSRTASRPTWGMPRSEGRGVPGDLE